MTTTSHLISSTRNGARTHQCDQCDKAFPNAKGLVMHKGRVHSRKILAFREQKTPTGRPRRKYGPHKRRTVKRAISQHALVERILERHASPNPVRIECPNCRFDFDLLTSSKISAKFCPGCGTPLQTFIEKLQALLKP